MGLVVDERNPEALWSCLENYEAKVTERFQEGKDVSELDAQIRKLKNLSEGLQDVDRKIKEDKDALAKWAERILGKDLATTFGSRFNRMSDKEVKVYMRCIESVNERKRALDQKRELFLKVIDGVSELKKRLGSLRGE